MKHKLTQHIDQLGIDFLRLVAPDKLKPFDKLVSAESDLGCLKAQLRSRITKLQAERLKLMEIYQILEDVETGICHMQVEELLGAFGK